MNKEKKAMLSRPIYVEHDEVITNSTLGFIGYFISKFKWLMLGLTFFEIISKILVVTLPFLLKDIVDAMQNTDQPQELFANNEFRNLILIFILVTICIEISSRLAAWCKYFFSTNMVATVRVEMFGYIQKHSHDFFMSRFAGSIGNKITQTSSAVKDVCFQAFRNFLPLVVAFLVTAAMSYTIHFGISMLFLGWLTIFLGFTFYMAPKIARRSVVYSEERSRFTGHIIDVLTNNITLRSNAAYNHEFGNTSHRADALIYQGRRTLLLLEVARTVQSVLIFLLISGVLVYALYAWSNNQLTLGALAFLLPVTMTLTTLANDVASRLVEFFEQYGTIEEGLQYMIHPYDIQDKPKAESLSVIDCNLEFKDVNFSYQTTGKKGIHKIGVFNELSFSIPSHQKIGLIGPSGAGKTSLVALLLRFYDPDEGSISIDNQDIKTITQQSLRQNIAYIPQDTSLFHRSLYDNIAYSCPDAKRDEVIDAAKKACAHEFIERLPNGYDTIVGERGMKLSGGQRQRIAIARAILKDSPILVLDEATSALDSDSEKTIQASLKELMKGKTVIAIAHRLSTISHMDRLLVLDEGKIVEDGSHKELLKHGGLYAKLWNMQSGGFLPED